MMATLITSYVPELLHSPTLWVPVVVGFYVIVLGLCLMRALNQQKTEIDRIRKEKNPIFSMLDEDEDEDDRKTS